MIDILYFKYLVDEMCRRVKENRQLLEEEKEKNENIGRAHPKFKRMRISPVFFYLAQFLNSVNIKHNEQG